MAQNNRRYLRLSLAVNVGLLLVCAYLGYAATTYYERSLGAALAVPVTTAGEHHSVLWLLGDSRIQQWARHDVLDGYYVGLPGATSWQIRNYLDTSDLSVFAGKRVVLQFGVNDLRVLGVQPDRASDVVADVFANVLYVAETLAEVASEVIVLTLFPVDTPTLPRSLVWSTAINEAVMTLNTKLVGEVDSGTVSVLDADQWLRPPEAALFVDPLHMSALAYDKLNSGLQVRLNHAVQ